VGVSFDAVVIGCGRMGAFTSPGVRQYAPPCWLPLAHAEAIRAHPALSLVGLADVDAGTLARAAAEYGVQRTYADPSRLFDELRPALAGVATRTVGRAAIIEHALVRGTRALHVEKPLCNSMRELAGLQRAFAGDGRFLTYGTVRRFLAPYRAAVEYVRSGRLGALLEVQVNLGRGPLYWTHPHSVDLLLFATGGTPVRSVSARLSNVVAGVSPSVVESDPVIESATLLFADGVEGRITRTPGCDLVLACEQGQVVVEADGRSLQSYAPADGDAYCRHADLPVPAGGEGGTLAPFAELVRCLQGDAAAVARNAELRRDIWLGQKILFGLVQSHQAQGHPVPLDEIRDDWVIWARSGGRHA
jgi:predicted dehydrogenase